MLLLPHSAQIGIDYRALTSPLWTARTQGWCTNVSPSWSAADDGPRHDRCDNSPLDFKSS